MAMTPSGLSGELFSQLESVFTIVDSTTLQKFCDAVGNAVVTYIQDNADVSPAAHSGEPLTNPVGQSIDVTSGPGAGSSGATDAPQEIEGLGSIL